MCCEYKLARLKRCCQLLNSCPASMVNFILFAHGQLLKFYHCSHKNHPEQLLSCLVGISWLLLLIAASSKTFTGTQRLRDGWVSSSQNTWFQDPVLFSADTMNIFSLANQIKFTIKAGTQLTARVETSKLVLTTHYDISITSWQAKNI